MKWVSLSAKHAELVVAHVELSKGAKFLFVERFDLLTLTLGSTKRWPKAKTLIAFARSQCDMTDKRAKEILAEVAHCVQCAANEGVL